MSELHMENFCGLCSEHLSRCKCSERALKEQVVSLRSRVGELEAHVVQMDGIKDSMIERVVELEQQARGHEIAQDIADEQLSSKAAECEALRGALEKIKEVADQEWPGLQNSVLRFKGVTVSEMCRV